MPTDMISRLSKRAKVIWWRKIAISTNGMKKSCYKYEKRTLIHILQYL